MNDTSPLAIRHLTHHLVFMVDDCVVHLEFGQGLMRHVADVSGTVLGAGLSVGLAQKVFQKVKSGVRDSSKIAWW